MSDEQPIRRQWRWYRTANGRCVAREEFAGLAEHGQAALMEAIKRYNRGESRPAEVKPLGKGLYELRVVVGNDPFRAIFFQDSPVHRVCVLAIYKNQQKLPQSDLNVARQRMIDWQARDGSF